MNISDSIFVSEDTLVYEPIRELEVNISADDIDMFPISMVNQNSQYANGTYTELSDNLKEGKPQGYSMFHEDSLLLVVLFIVGVYSLVNYYMGKITDDVFSIFSFRRVSDKDDSNDYKNSSLNVSWRGFFIFLASMTSLSLFAYCVGTYYDLFPTLPYGQMWWLVICFAVFVVALAIRQIICILTSGISGQKKLFLEYVSTVYNGYKLTAFILLFSSIFVLYTHFVPIKVFFHLSFVAIGVIILIRYLKLFLFFVRGNVSIFYSFLYLCALEILPVAVIVKHVNGLM